MRRETGLARTSPHRLLDDAVMDIVVEGTSVIDAQDLVEQVMSKHKVVLPIAQVRRWVAEQGFLQAGKDESGQSKYRIAADGVS